MILVATHEQPTLFGSDLKFSEDIIVVDATSFAIKKAIDSLLCRKDIKNKELANKALHQAFNPSDKTARVKH